ncbi:ribonuclease H-like domain-containing protein [Tanacetum coccineum]
MVISSSISSSSSDNEVQKCSKQCLETFKTLQKNYDSEREKHSKARLEIQGYELALESLESRILVHEKNELAWGEKYEFQNYELKCREIKINNLSLELEKVVKERDDLKLKIEKWEESSKNLDELLNSQMSARDKTSLGYGTQLNEMSNNSKTDNEISLSVFDVRSSDEENTPANDKFSKADRFHVVPPPIIGNFLTPRADISFAGLDEYAIRKKIIESKTTDFNTKTSKTIGVLTRTGLITPVKQNKKRASHLVSTARPVSTVRPFTSKIAQTGDAIRPIYPRMDYVRPRGSYSPIKRSYYTKLAFRPKDLKQDVKTFGVQNMTTAWTRAVFNTGKGNMDTDLKKSRLVWRPNGNYLDHVSKDSGSFMLKKGNPEILLQDHAVVDSGYSSHMIGNKAYLSDNEDFNRGFMAFGSDPKGGKITGKGNIKTANLDFDDVYFVDELKFNLFSISQICDNKNSILFTETECLILSPSFKLLDESQVVLRAPRKDDVYSLDLKNIVPSGCITFLYANATADESKLWHRRLGHVNFKNINKLVKGHLVRDLPLKVFVNDHTCVVCKQDLENQLNHNVKIIRCDNGTEFKNHAINEFCAKKGIKREFSVARTPQQNGVAERKNRTLIEAARTIYSTTSKAFRVYNKRTKRVEENLHIDFLEDQPNMAGTGPNWMFDLDFLTNSMNYIPVSVENQVNVDVVTQDSYVAGSSGKDKGPTQEYILLLLQRHRTRIPVEDVAPAAHEKPFESSPKDNNVQDSEDVANKVGQNQMTEDEQVLHDDLENMIAQEVATCTNILSTVRSSVSTATMAYICTTSTPTSANTSDSSFVYLGGKIPIDASTLPNDDLPIDLNMPALEDDSNAVSGDGIFNGAYDDENVGTVADFNNMDDTINISPIPTLRIHKNHLKDQILGDPKSAVQTRGKIQKASLAQQELVSYISKKNRTNHKDHQNCLLACFHSQEEPKNISQALKDESWVEAMQEELLHVFLYGTIEEEVCVHQLPGFVDPAHPNKVYKVIKALYGLHQAPRAWYETLYSFMMENGYRRVKQQPDGIFISQDKYVTNILKKFEFWSIRTATTPIEANKPLVKDEDGKDIDVHDYRSMIGSLMYLTASRPDIMFAVCACPRDLRFELEAYSDSDYRGASLDRKSTTGGCQFLGRRLISWQCKKQTIVANSTTKAEYVAAANYSSIEGRQDDLLESLERDIDGTEELLLPDLLILWLTKVCTDSAKYITAKLAGKPITISEASIRSDLLFDDADGIDSLPNQAIFDAIQIMSYEGDLTDEGKASERQSEPQPTPSPPYLSADHLETQPDPSPRPSPTIPIPNSIPEGSGGNHGGQSSSDRSLSGNEDGLTLQSVYDLCVSLCKQVTDQAKEIKHLKAQIKKLKKKAKPVITHHKAWMKSVSMKQRLAGKKSLKTKWMQKESVSKQGRKPAKAEPTVHKDPALDDLDDIVDDAMDYMESEDAQDNSVVLEEKESTQEVSDQKLMKVLLMANSRTSIKYSAPTPVFPENDETIAEFLTNDTSTRIELTLKPLPKIDPKDKGKKVLEEEAESDVESEGVNEAERKFDQLAKDEEIARKVQEDWEAEEEMKKLAEEEATKYEHVVMNLVSHLESGTFTTIFTCHAFNQLAINLGDEYGFVIRPCVVRVPFESVRIDL